MYTTNKSTTTAIIDDLEIIVEMLSRKFKTSSIKSNDTLKEQFLPLAIQVQRNALIYDSLLKVGSFDDDRDDPSPLEKIAIEIAEIASK